MSEQPPQEPGVPPQNPGVPPPSAGTPPPGPAQPPPNPYQPYAPGYSPTGAPMWAPDHPDTTTVLIMGILGIAVCQLVAPFAWIKGRRVREEIDASGGQLGGRSQVQLGYVLGIVGSCLLGFYVLGGIAYVGIVALAIAGSA